MTRNRSIRTTGCSATRIVALTLVLLPAVALALPAEGPEPRDPLAEHLFVPDLVMRHQAEIGLTAAQRQALIEEMQGAQSAMVPLQFEVSEASEALERLLSARRVDEKAVRAQALRVMEIETRVKVRHLTLLVRIKNLLSAEQQERLAPLRAGGGQ